MLTPVVIYKQRLLHENEVAQCYDAEQSHFRKFCQERKEQLSLNDPFIFLAVQFAISLNV